MLITHYRASWTGVGRYQGPVKYPGWLVDPDEIEKLPADIRGMVRGNNGGFGIVESAEEPDEELIEILTGQK